MQPISSDPDFQNLSPEDKHAVLYHSDADYAALSPADQKAVLAHLGTSAGSENPYQPTGLDKAADVINSGMQKVAPAMQMAGRAATGIMGLANPIEGAATYAAQSLGDNVTALANKAGESVAEGSSQAYPKMNPYVAATAGLATSILGNPMTYLPMGKAKISSRPFMVPEVAAGRQAGVSAMEGIGGPVSRAEMTGGGFSTSLENTLDKTVLGGKAGEARRGAQQTALQSEKTRLQERLGSGRDEYAAGLEAKGAVPGREKAMKGKRDEMFNAIPDNVYIHPKEAKSIADTIIQEQGEYFPTTRNSDVISIAKDIQNANLEGPLGGVGEPGGYTRHPLESQRSIPLEKSEPGGYKFGADPQMKDKPIYQASYSAGPPGEALPPKSNYQQLKRLRETLGGKIQEATQAGRMSEARDFTRLKVGLDKDIESFVSGQTEPLDKMIAGEFSQTYKKANAFSGAFKDLFQGKEAGRLADMNPERVGQSIFIPNNETTIKRFRALAGEEGFTPLKGAFTQKLLESPNVGSELDKLKGSANAIYTPEELSQLRRYADAQGVPKLVPSQQGTHGSARSNIAGGQYGTLAASIGSGMTAMAAGHPVVGLATMAGGVGQFVAPKIISHIYEGMSKGVTFSVPHAALRGSVIAEYMKRKQTQ